MDIVIKWEIGQIAEKIGLEVDIPLQFPDPPDPGKGKFIVRRCRTCAFRVRCDFPSFGGCSSPKFNRTGDVSTATDGVELGGLALFGEDFGCVHWQEKED